MKKVVLVTGHYWRSKRKAGFHWLADAYHRMGWDVLFFTTSISWVSWLRRDHRSRYKEVLRQRRRIVEVGSNFRSYVWFTPFHPADLRLNWLNRLTSGMFQLYGNLPLGEAEGFIKTADLFVFESTPGLLLVERFRKLNPAARFVYRVSDDLRLLRTHPVVLEAERNLLSRFDLVSVPSPYLFRLFAGKTRNLRLHYHAIRKDLFDREWRNPYERDGLPNLVFVGVSHFDHDFLERASRLFPRWRFHIIGPIDPTPHRANVIFYGEVPFEETVPYIKFADIGLANWAYRPGAESFSDSLKIIQYTYVRLPVVAPDFIRSNRLNVVTYRPGDDQSIANALMAARSMDRSNISVEGIYSWEELAATLSGEA